MLLNIVYAKFVSGHMRAHVNRVHPNNQDPSVNAPYHTDHACPHCRNSYSSERHLKAHMRVEHKVGVACRVSYSKMSSREMLN